MGVSGGVQKGEYEFLSCEAVGGGDVCREGVEEGGEGEEGCGAVGEGWAEVDGGAG